MIARTQKSKDEALNYNRKYFLHFQEKDKVIEAQCIGFSLEENGNYAVFVYRRDNNNIIWQQISDREMIVSEGNVIVLPKWENLPVDRIEVYNKKSEDYKWRFDDLDKLLREARM